LMTLSAWAGTIFANKASSPAVVFPFNRISFPCALMPGCGPDRTQAPCQVLTRQNIY
jgi:hypothetical protein